MGQEKCWGIKHINLLGFYAVNLISKKAGCINLCSISVEYPKDIILNDTSYEYEYKYCFTSLSAQSWQYRDRRKPEAGTMPYSYFEWLQGFFIVHSIIGSTVHSIPLNSLEHCICTATNDTSYVTTCTICYRNKKLKLLDMGFNNICNNPLIAKFKKKHMDYSCRPTHQTQRILNNLG